MSRPSKPAEVIAMEGKTHLTNEEIEFRKQQEEALLTGMPMTEFQDTKDNPISHEEFLRIRKNLRKINKNDDMFAGAINRYCKLFAECKDFVEKREDFHKNLIELGDEWTRQHELEKDQREMTVFDYLKLKTTIQAQEIALDKQVQKKREMMLAIEKEDLMTIAGALRAIPKKPFNKKEGGDNEDELYSILNL